MRHTPPTACRIPSISGIGFEAKKKPIKLSLGKGCTRTSAEVARLRGGGGKSPGPAYTLVRGGNSLGIFLSSSRDNCPPRESERRDRDSHQVPPGEGSRTGTARGATAPVSAESGAWPGIACGADSAVVALARASGLDLRAGLVEAMNSEIAQATSPAPLAILLLGPTGSGKTALSLALGQRFDGEIVSCDSVAVYRGLDLGSAKPSAEERASLPHHLIDVADPDQTFTAGEYSRQARKALAEIAERGRLPIVTGGTGLYLRALTEGLFAGPERQDEIRERLRRGQARSEERQSPNWLQRILARLDPASAERIHANDLPKLIRAIEICLAGRRPMSEVLSDRAKARDPLAGFRLVKIGLNPPRAALYDRLNHRCAAMFAAGLVEETKGLLDRYGPTQSLDSLGYRQAAAILAGSMSETEGISAAQQGHRNYAKRQLTWFRREKDVHWLESFGDGTEAMHAAFEVVESAIEMGASQAG